MTQKKKSWCHECYSDFVYEPVFLNSEAYDKASSKLIRGHDKLENVYKLIRV